MKAVVSIVKCEDYTPSKVLRAVKEVIDLLGGMGKFVQPGQKVLLKPNLLSARPPESAVCTHPAVVEAAAGLVMAAEGVCAIGDSPSIGGDPEGYQRLLRTTGMQDVIDRTGASAVRFDDAAVDQGIPDAKVFRRLLLAEVLNDADVLINLPKFKTHDLTRLTGAVKNLFGCIPGRRKAKFHLQAGDSSEMFAQMLVDLLRAVRPALSIMDGIVGMDGQGPAAGRRRNFGLILASADPVALDAVACVAAGVDPMAIPTIRLASEQGVGATDVESIETVGLQPEDVRIADFILPERSDLVSRIPRPLYRMLRNQLVSSPAFVREKCSGCRSCVEMCPIHAISGEGDRLRVNYSECIRCYCCREVCPEEAICLRTGRISGSLEAALAVRRKIRSIIRRETSP